jgi:hypothetical protein
MWFTAHREPLPRQLSGRSRTRRRGSRDDWDLRSAAQAAAFGEVKRWHGVELAEYFVDSKGRTLREALKAQRQPPAEHVCDVDHHENSISHRGRAASWTLDQ